MNTLLDNLRFTIRSTFDLYSTFGKKLYRNSLLVLLIIGAASYLVAGAFVLLVGNLFDRPDIVGLGTRDYPFDRLFSIPEFVGLSTAIIILLIGLYGIVLYRARLANEALKSNPLRYISSITSHEWRLTSILLLVLLAFNALLFTNPFRADDLGGGLLGMFSSLGAEFTLKELAYEVLEAIRILILPYFLAVLIVLYSIWGKINLDILREYRSAWIAGLILLFSLNAVFSAINTLFQNTVLRLMIIPFMPSAEPSARPSPLDIGLPSAEQSGLDLGIWIVIILGATCTLLFAALFYPAMAFSLVLPFQHEEEKLAKVVEENIEVRSDDESDRT